MRTGALLPYQGRRCHSDLGYRARLRTSSERCELEAERSPEDLYFDLEWHALDYDEDCRAKAEARHKILMDAIKSGSSFPRVEPGQTTGAEKWYVNLLDSLETFDAGAVSLATLTVSEAVAFLDKLTSLEGVAKLLAFQRTHRYLGFGFFSHVQPPLAFAFLLARLGRADSANESDLEYCEKITVREDVRPKLDRASQKRWPIRSLYSPETRKTPK